MVMSLRFPDPLRFKKLMWPDVIFYDKQIEIIYSVIENDETVVPAGNMLGKDFIAGFIAVYYFITRPVVRILTTSIKDDHLQVLWGEINGFIQSSKFPMDVKRGGPLFVNHNKIRKVRWNDRTIRCPKSYLIGSVSDTIEGMAGHHAPYTLAIMDEASGIDTPVYNQVDTWARKKLIIGNTNPCSNFFYHGVEAGDLIAHSGAVHIS